MQLHFVHMDVAKHVVYYNEDDLTLNVFTNNHEKEIAGFAGHANRCTGLVIL